MAVILEFKKTDTDTEASLKIAANKAIEQIEVKRYIREAQARGAQSILCYGIGFSAKKLKIEESQGQEP